MQIQNNVTLSNKPLSTKLRFTSRISLNNAGRFDPLTGMIIAAIIGLPFFVFETALDRLSLKSLRNGLPPFDKNNDGILELPEAIQFIMDKIDADGNGNLDPEELERLSKIQEDIKQGFTGKRCAQALEKAGQELLTAQQFEEWRLRKELKHQLKSLKAEQQNNKTSL